MPDRPKEKTEGTSTLDGQADTHRWQAVQMDVYLSMLTEPGR